MSWVSSWRARLWPWRRWLVVLLVLLVVRVALPEVLRRVLISQASQALRARVEVGDLDLSLLRGGVALEDVAIFAPATPTGGEQPLIAWKRLAVELHWLPLFRKTVQLRELVLDTPHVALDRLADGQINLMALVPVSEAPAAPTPAPATAKAAWSFGVDRLVLRRGGLLFRDFEVKDTEPLEMSFEEIQVRDIALRPGLYGQPATVHLELAFDQASLRLDARLTMLDQGFDLDADLEAHALPLRRSRLYIPSVGWSALQGEVDATLNYRLETDKRNEVRGTVSLRDVAVRVSALEEPALAWKDLTVKVDPLDLIAHRAAVADVTLDGASLLVRPQGGDLLPFLAASTSKAVHAVAAATPAAGSEAPAAPATEKAEAATKVEANPWHWSVASLHLGDSRVRLLGDAEPLDVGIGASAGGIADSGEQPGTAEVTLTVGEGQVALKGSVKVAPPAFGGSLKISDLSLPELARAAAAVPPGLLQSARLSSDLTVEAGLAAAEDGTAPAAGDVRVRGKLSLGDLHVTGVTPQDFSLTAKSIDLGINELDVPGALPSSAGAAASDVRFKGQLALGDWMLSGPDPKTFSVGAHAFEVPITAISAPDIFSTEEKTAGAAPIGVTLGDVRLEKPTVQVTRTAEGFALPNFSGPPTKAEASPPPKGTPHAIEVTLASLRLDGGTVDMSDRTMKPFFNGRLSAVDADLEQVRWPGPSVGSLKLSAVGSEQGKLDIYGALSEGSGWFQVDVDKLALPPFNPYATGFSSYSIGSGKLSLSSKASFAKGNYYADNWITLHDLDVQSGAGDSLFQQQFGIPLSMALALLRDMNGNIDLGIPVSGGTEGTKIGLFTVIRSALQHAIVNALASPLKLVGAVFGGKGKAASLAPAPISFLRGRAEPAAEGAAQVAQLGQLLASRPAIGVTLETAVSEDDVRWLREQDLLKTWQSEGLIARLGALIQKGRRDRVRDALEARAKDKPGTLSPEDSKALDDWLAEQPAIPAAQLRELAEARLQRVQKLLQEGSGVGSNRIGLAEPRAQLTRGAPVVSVNLGARQ